MSEQFRLIIHDAQDAFTNMAIDEAIIRSAKEIQKPTVRLYSWKPEAISIGYFQSLKQEVDIEKCSELGVDLVRKTTGGGAVFHDEELTYSFVCTEESNIVPKAILDSYARICGAVVNSFKSFGLDASFVPINDIIVNGKKISGNAQTRRYNSVLQHGTLLLGVDVEKMFSLLKVPDEKIRDKMIKVVSERVTSLEKELSRKVPFAEAAQKVKEGFEEEFKVELVEEPLAKEEISLAEQIRKEKFSLRDWNYMR